jgi:hypothetical protein
VAVPGVAAVALAQEGVDQIVARMSLPQKVGQLCPIR